MRLVFLALVALTLTACGSTTQQQPPPATVFDASGTWNLSDAMPTMLWTLTVTDTSNQLTGTARDPLNNVAQIVQGYKAPFEGFPHESVFTYELENTSSPCASFYTGKKVTAQYVATGRFTSERRFEGTLDVNNCNPKTGGLETSKNDVAVTMTR
jgi:hypothetical protein